MNVQSPIADARLLFRNGLVFDGSGTPPAPGDVVVRGNTIESVRVGGGTVAEPGDVVVDCTGATVMPGLVESHAHLTFPSAVGHLDTRFNPPLDVSFFRELPPPDELLAIARRNAAILLRAGFTSAYSAGSLTPVPTEVHLKAELEQGISRGPRLRTASFERDNNPVRLGPRGPEPKATGPAAVRDFVREQAELGFDSVKLLLSNDDVFVPGGSRVTQYSAAEAAAAGEQARASGVLLNCHAQSSQAVELAVRQGFRSIYHCTYADEAAIDLLEEHKDEIFLSPAVGIMWANVHEGAEFGIDAGRAEAMGSVAALAAQQELYRELRRRGLRVLPGGDYGFPNNPIGRNARDLQLFVDLFGYTPAEVLRAATHLGGLLMQRPVGLLTGGYLADLLVVQGDPCRDVSRLADPANLLAVLQDGEFVHRAPQLRSELAGAR
ncbi:amidohydrolase family protein [Nocardia sp. BMG111209]|uniref:amidohydrolase family protein n=1 Tax=Nocardia sp. BMG111209 TaxID=1160137 RepID=UPI00037D439D|nr:amidohydrolase family protein [Nocardia sp. BMG111209]